MTQMDKEGFIKETLRQAFPEPLRVADVLRMDGASDIPLLVDIHSDFPNGYVTMARRGPGDVCDSWLVINNDQDLEKWKSGDLLLYGFSGPRKWCLSYISQSWSVRISEVAGERVYGEVLLGGSVIGRFTWRKYVPHLIGDIVGVLPESLKQSCIDVSSKAYESLQ